jgi:plastocyanin domain-containing protein
MKRTIIAAGLAAALVLSLPGCRVKAQGLSGQEASRFNSVSGAPAAKAVPAAAESTPYRNPAVLEGDVQTIATTFTSRRYMPITVQAGIPVRWTITVEPGNLNGCNAAMVIPKLEIGQRLKVGETVVEFTPTETGNLAYSCWMGMIRSSITVVDDLHNTL